MGRVDSRPCVVPVNVLPETLWLHGTLAHTTYDHDERVRLWQYPILSHLAAGHPHYMAHSLSLHTIRGRLRASAWNVD